MTGLKFCVNCKHHIQETMSSSARCTSPNNAEVDLVDGKVTYRYLFCNTHRNGEAAKALSNVCGPRGSWFEPKE